MPELGVVGNGRYGKLPLRAGGCLESFGASRADTLTQWLGFPKMGTLGPPPRRPRCRPQGGRELGAYTSGFEPTLSWRFLVDYVQHGIGNLILARP